MKNENISGLQLVNMKQGLWENLCELLGGTVDLQQLRRNNTRLELFPPHRHDVDNDWTDYADWTFLIHKTFVRRLIAYNPYVDEWTSFRFARQIVYLCADVVDKFVASREFEDCMFDIMETFVSTLRSFFEIYDRCQSPLEHAFLIGAACSTDYKYGKYGFLSWNQLLTPDIFDAQYVFRNYRLDFAIQHKEKGIKIAVELDGHTYHERTVEQAVNDRSRDRELALHGWKVIRFHRKELETNLRKCVADTAFLYASCLDPDLPRRVEAYRQKHRERLQKLTNSKKNGNS
jgi:very-short-patch-repair endonuclease